MKSQLSQRLKTYLDKLKMLNITKQQLVMCILAGVLLFVIALPVKEPDDGKENGNQILETETGMISDSGEYMKFDWEQETGEDEESKVEKKLTNMLESIEGCGKSKVMVTMEGGTVRGILVVCEGGDDTKIKCEVTNALCALLQIEAHKIKIMKMK